MQQLGISNWGMPQIGFERFARFAAELGFAGVELTVLPAWSTRIEAIDRAATDRWRGLLGELGLALPAIAAHSPLLDVDEAALADSYGRLNRAIELARELCPENPPAINTTIGGSSGAWDAQRQQALERLGPLLDRARAAAVDIALEPHVGSALHTPEQTAWMLDQLGRQNLGVNFDYSHFLAQGIALGHSVDLLAADTVHTHLKGVKGRWPDHEFLVPGEDDYDYAEELWLMDAAGYAGFQTLEVSVMVQRRPGYDALESARLGHATLQRAFRAAGLKI
ncbi:MAG: sugar phosphate isomerase/epimerase [Chloroflexota bacterium]|nr:sugar phosphate isomerase/epimerase [Chloroflexota bacterium]